MSSLSKIVPWSKSCCFPWRWIDRPSLTGIKGGKPRKETLQVGLPWASGPPIQEAQIQAWRHPEVTESKWVSLYINYTWAIPEEPFLGKSLLMETVKEDVCNRSGRGQGASDSGLFVCLFVSPGLCTFVAGRQEVSRWLYLLPKNQFRLGNWLIVS